MRPFKQKVIGLCVVCFVPKDDEWTYNHFMIFASSATSTAQTVYNYKYTYENASVYRRVTEQQSR